MTARHQERRFDPAYAETLVRIAEQDFKSGRFLENGVPTGEALERPPLHPRTRLGPHSAPPTPPEGAGKRAVLQHMPVHGALQVGSTSGGWELE